MRLGLQRSLLYTDPSGGKLYQGNRYDVADVDKEYYSLLILAAYDYQPQILTPEQSKVFEPSPYDEERYDDEDTKELIVTPKTPGEIIRIPLTEPAMDEAELIGWTHRPYLHTVGRRAYTTIKQGGTVLSSCWGGLQRSSAVSAAILWHLGERPMQKVIERLTEERGFGCEGLHKILMLCEERWIENENYRKSKSTNK